VPTYYYHEEGGHSEELDADDMSTAPATVVVFRVDNRDKDVFALFPHEKEDYGDHCSCYVHIGGHCAANYAACIRHSRPATPEEYQRMQQELERMGYNLVIRKRR
jgi:hypothetical protein